MAKFFWNLKHGRSHAGKTKQPERLLLLEGALKQQEMFLQRKMIGEPPNDEYNFLLFAEHDRVYVWPKSDQEKRDKLGDNARLFRPGMGPPPAPTYALPENRGGSITFHGPGQIVCYIITCMEDLGIRGPRHIDSIIDEGIKEFLLGLGIKGYATSELCHIQDIETLQNLSSQGILRINSDGENHIITSAQGVWVVTSQKEARKIASRGLRIVVQKYSGDAVKRFTKYGFSINITTDLSYFDYIYPCGEDIKMTSVQDLTGECYPIYKIAPMIAEILIRRFNEIEKAS